MNYDLEENTLYIFTDGASRPVFNHKCNKKTGRHGGMGIWFAYYDKNFKIIEEDKSDYISYTQATNQDMELGASIAALEYLTKLDTLDFNKIIIVTDSLFLCDHWKCAVYGYRDKPGIGRRTKDGDLVKHKKERKKLAKYRKEVNSIHGKKVDFEKVKALHGKNDGYRTIYNDYNDKADTSAVRGAQSKTRVINNNVSIRAPFFKSSKWNKETYLDLGGQIVYIHIHNAAYYRQKRFRYNYEVVSWDSQYFMQTAWIHYDRKTLSAEYIYLVKIKNDGSNQIEEIISEHSKEEIKQKMIEAGIDTSILYGKLGKE